MGQSIKEQIEIIKNQRFINRYIQMADQNLVTGYRVKDKSLNAHYNTNSDWLERKKIPSVTFTTNNNIQIHDDSDITYLYDDRIHEFNQAYQETNEHLEK
jgi:hypothetical protein|tara:strand:- start:1903 stop:2202 length:300 start_codon:yes stop_codon:yes gene_type:complete